MKTSKTHFEQIPVATVKKMPCEFPARGDRMPDVDPTFGDWRDLARRVEVETDTNKMLKLVEELIEKIDEEQNQKRRSVRHASSSPATNSGSDLRQT